MSCALPTSDARRPKHPSRSENLSKSYTKGGGRKSDSPTEWASRAWVAVERSLFRCTYPLGCIDVHSPNHHLWDDDRKAFIELYAKRLEEGSAIKWLKFHTSYCFAKAYNQTELPTVPGEFAPYEKPGRFVGKVLGRALQQTMARGASGNWADRRCALDVLMSKIGFPPAPQEFVEKTLKDHRLALTSEHVTENSSDRDLRRSQVESKIYEIVQKVFEGQRFSHQDLFPSLRASLNGSRAEGGAFGELMRNFELPVRLCSSELVLMGFEPKAGCFELRLPNIDLLIESFHDSVDRCWLDRLDDRLKAQPLPILEPLKVRVITKGQAAEYYRCLELQRLMHRRLRQVPIFSYMGKPIDDAEFGRAFGCREDLREGEFYVSGDYKSATDNLDPALSNFAWKSICEFVHINWEGEEKYLIDTPYFQLGLKALTGHELFYSKDDSPREFDHFPQTWGQLMGSPMSFPILCLVNAGATLAALDRPFKWQDRLRINGDDIGFITNLEGYEKWKLYTGECGLEFSLGKNYTSTEFLIINSQLRRPPMKKWEIFEKPTGYLLDYESHAVDSEGKSLGVQTRFCPELETTVRPCPWHLEGFLNQSLLYHTERKGVEAGKQKDVYWTDLEELSKEVLHGIPDGEQFKVLKLFLNAHHSVLGEMPSYVNLWFPRRLGGAGVQLPHGHTMEELASEGRSVDLLAKQRKQAAFLACDPSRRQKYVKTPSSLTSCFEKALKEVRDIADKQAAPRLCRLETGMFPGDRPKLEGPYILGLSIEALHQLCVWEQDEQIGERSETDSKVVHHRLNDLLSQRYVNWTRNSLAHSLQEMSFEALTAFRETSTFVSYIDILAKPLVDRTMDQGWLESPLVGLLL